MQRRLADVLPASSSGSAAGIAAYKACELLRLLTESGHQVRVVPTAAALRFVGEATWAALSGQPVTTDVWTDVARGAARPARAGTPTWSWSRPPPPTCWPRPPHGLADDLLTTTLLTARCPVVFAPAMHTEMWEHPATQANVATLRRRGAIVLEPAVGRLTGADTGTGPAARPGRDLRRRRSGCWLRGAARCRRPGRPPRGGHRRRHPRAARPGPVPRQPLLRASRATRWPARRSPAAPRSPLVAANVALPDPAGVEVIRVVTAASCARRSLAAAEAPTRS